VPKIQNFENIKIKNLKYQNYLVCEKLYKIQMLGGAGGILFGLIKYFKTKKTLVLNFGNKNKIKELLVPII
jgi:hypothetical protein